MGIFGNYKFIEFMVKRYFAFLLYKVNFVDTYSDSKPIFVVFSLLLIVMWVLKVEGTAAFKECLIVSFGGRFNLR